MSQINVNTIKNKSGAGAPNFPAGAVVTGVVTATSFTGNLTGDASGSSGSCTGNAATATVATNAQGLTGTPAIVVGDITAAAATFSGNVSIAKTLTYEDVKNIDSVGVVTAREGIFIPDAKKLEIGNTTGAGDLHIHHTSGNSVIENGTGYLHLKSDSISLAAKSVGENMLVAVKDGAVSLMYDGSTKFATTNTGVSVTGKVVDDKGDVRNIPNLSKTSAYTIVATDGGKAIHITTGGVTVPNATMAGGEAVTIINSSGSNQTITQGSGLTMYNSADASTGNRTLAGRGMCTIWWHNGSTAYISGSGLS